ncbi:RNA polymerase-binding protein RbpA [Rathayibacter tritici]|uniref:RNA polymerase-binding protein RbpA n=1 Tax=Rathayibacter tritici TaxID=33888 RepID=A0A160KSF1_9MICO|nr:RNA polymerase-binding protein RbpA [Rathayibacter tritici]AND16453.1 electron transporter [Rathayibacter tritici]PPF31742.1 RNA polymerase-binding protein RbpA [Rathayibacter tritici]PPF70225.1 RNA polymerase-binding protein RbpA [Rathayibacter tritici]PPG08508.1 RNA polymerase-binding protein RbpA [Rathayibacter tritici]PPI13055.1 RNA polymerase-binding protein RbpA [Rathayibacter tritici]
MADRSLRGMRLGSQSLQSEEGVVFSARSTYEYHCANCGHDTDMVFSADAEAPETWECRSCGHEATLMVDSKPVVVDKGEQKVPRTHWDMLLERRTRAELEELLEERLAYLRARRGEHKIGA